jgi:hypothetical protein
MLGLGLGLRLWLRLWPKLRLRLGKATVESSCLMFRFKALA